jgi:two-component system, sensor histidine kinase PdtaS
MWSHYLKKIILCTVLLIFNYTISYGQIVDLKKEIKYKKVFVDTDNFGASYLTILEDAFDKVKIDSIRFSILNDLAYYWHTRNLIKALNFTEKGLNFTKAANDTLWEGRFQITQGAILLRMEKLDSAFTILNEAKGKVKLEDLAFINTQLGYVFERKGQLKKAVDYALESLKIGGKLNNKNIIALAYSDLSNLFWKQSKFEIGLEYGLKAVSLFEEVGINNLDYDFTLYVVGNNYLAIKQYQKALNYYEHSIAIGERYGFYNNLSDVYISLVDLYAYLNNFNKAETAGANAIKFAELLDNNFMLMRSWLSVGKLQYLEGKYISAIKSLQKSITIATKDFGDAYYLSEAYETLGKAFAGNHNYKEAYHSFAEYDRLKNEIFTTEASQRILVLQTEFDMARKESTIEEQKTKLKQQRTKQTFMTIIAGLLFILLIVLYKTFQNNRKKNKLLQQQNKEKEFLLKEIHHRVKNNLEIVSSLLALASAQTTDLNVQEVMQDSQNRVYSMSLIHQKLYQGKNIAAVEMKGYFINLGTYILESFGVIERITLECNMDTLELDIDTAIPLGLIVNELLTNALKYAFPKNRKGNIKIELKQLNSHTIKLEVADNGIGQLQRSPNKSTGFGTQLINLLTQQLDGEMKQKTLGGTITTFEFNVTNVI